MTAKKEIMRRNASQKSYVKLKILLKKETVRRNEHYLSSTHIYNIEGNCVSPVNVSIEFFQYAKKLFDWI